MAQSTPPPDDTTAPGPHQGLLDLLALLPAGSTLEDAYRFRKASIQRLRQPCSFLDRELGIVR